MSYVLLQARHINLSPSIKFVHMALQYDLNQISLDYFLFVKSFIVYCIKSYCYLSTIYFGWYTWYIFAIFRAKNSPKWKRLQKNLLLKQTFLTNNQIINWLAFVWEVASLFCQGLLTYSLTSNTLNLTFIFLPCTNSSSWSSPF